MARRYRNEEVDDEVARFLEAEEEKSSDKLYVPVKYRKTNTFSDVKSTQRAHAEPTEEGETSAEENQIGIKEEPVERNQSLVDVAEELRKKKAMLDKKTVKQIQQKEYEEVLLKEANQVQTNALQSKEEIALGLKYFESLKSTWRPPRYIAEQPESAHEAMRQKWHILVEGEKCPPPIKSFREMKIPECILEALKQKGINRPTPIQVQAIPALLSGRDIIGIAFTGSGKTLTFSLPMLMFALEEEVNMPLEPGEGPVGLILCPSRELAKQTYEVVDYFARALGRGGYPEIRSVLCIGGESKRSQVDIVRKKGVHCIVATPGRLNDLLNEGLINFDVCKYLTLDEGDRMLDLGFDEEVSSIISKFHKQRQTVLFSATMPQKFQDFAKNTLVKPLVVNVGRAGAANLDVIQEVEYVKREAKIVYLLECLQKTAPPVIIFCERKSDVDEIHEYLLVKGVEAASIHGGKDQSERNESIQLYKEGKKDVLVATDIAAKGLDFPDIQHVINFDMPTEIENYVHRIGRTGRCGKTGVATTFINKDVEESTLLDLKHLLIEAKQRVPPVLMALSDPDDDLVNINGVKGCAFCGGLGHRITECPKLDKDARRIGATKKDALAVLSINGPGNPPLCHEWLDPFQKATKYPALLLWNKNSKLSEVVRVLITTIQQNVPSTGYGYQQPPQRVPSGNAANMASPPTATATAVAVSPGTSLQVPLATVASVRGSGDYYATVVSAGVTPVPAPVPVSGYAGSISSTRPPPPQTNTAFATVRAPPANSTPPVTPLRPVSSTSSISSLSANQKPSSQYNLMEVVSDPPSRVNSLSKGQSAVEKDSGNEPGSPFMEIPPAPTAFPLLKSKTDAELEKCLSDPATFRELLEAVVCEDPNVDYLESMRDETRKANLSQAETTLQLENLNARQQEMVNLRETLRKSVIQYRSEHSRVSTQYSVRQGDIVSKLREKQDVYDAQSETLATNIVNGRFRGHAGGEEELSRCMQEFLTARRAYHTTVIQVDLVQRA